MSVNVKLREVATINFGFWIGDQGEKE